MKSIAIASAIAAASLGFASLAQAQNPRNFQLRAAPQPAQVVVQHQGHGHGNGHAYGHRNDRRDFARHDQRRFQAQGPRFQRGGYAPYEYRNRGYAVNDWRARHLSAPPQGYQWVHADNSNNYALIAIATGLIASIVLSQ
jgi:Ni/Co efflux regulator RcnB